MSRLSFRFSSFRVAYEREPAGGGETGDDRQGRATSERVGPDSGDECPGDEA
jgi:hypothetical protein